MPESTPTITAVLLKPKQIGTASETVAAARTDRLLEIDRERGLQGAR